MTKPTNIFCPLCKEWVGLVDHERGYHWSLMYVSDCEHKIQVSTATNFDGRPIKERMKKKELSEE